MAERPLVVLVDDDDIFRAFLVAALETDYECMTAKNGREGLELCRAGHVDFLITDIGMPELDGIQMLGQFQRDSRLSAIPVLVLTATHFTRRSRSELSRYSQVRSVLCKPCGVEQILSELRRALPGSGEPS